MSSSEQDQKPVFITKPLLNSIPDHLLPRFDPTYAEYYGKYNAGRLHTHQIPIEAYRADPMKYTISYGRALGPRVFRTTNQKCPVSGGHEINVRIYEPAEVDPDAAKRPVYINYHGGGFVFGSLAVDKDFCRRVCQEVGAVVFDVDYRLAPENPFPIPVEDCWAAFQWVCFLARLNFWCRVVESGGLWLTCPDRFASKRPRSSILISIEWRWAVCRPVDTWLLLLRSGAVILVSHSRSSC